MRYRIVSASADGHGVILTLSLGRSFEIVRWIPYNALDRWIVGDEITL